MGIPTRFLLGMLIRGDRRGRRDVLDDFEELELVQGMITSLTLSQEEITNATFVPTPTYFSANQTSLKLNVSKMPFDLMFITREKQVEYRRKSHWIESRLKKKHKYIEITHGYKRGARYFKAEILDVVLVEKVDPVSFSNGFVFESFEPRNS